MTRFQPLLRAPRKYLIYITLFVSLLVAMLPISVDMMTWFPDMLCMVLLYWAVNLPTRINIGSAFFWGLLADLVTGVPLGQHAIAYIVITYLVLIRQPQLVVLNLGMQAVIVSILLLLNLIVMTLIRAVYGENLIHWGVYLTPLISIFIWPMIDKIMFWLCYHHMR